ncbi:UTP--glucose-1-phosphate uridylyltransferase [Kangiella geojedonensis]|uniref:UTP--glucose-1-phosphate uridylyltransferase n=1 Tax=Kangiella geojedonensis TaxID=914150 RepID=A0A0F6RCF0_9GAMM|nr:UTP--glucose-1-phosphate uridylyltransferase [Kangiella geojedonensis]AKE52343.1 Glucose-1-phosphate uridylyltransferase [Kangiella geojedonensis]
MKAIIPVAGFGTRMLPASKAIPKEMITLIDRPLIQYVIEEAHAAGITEIILVTHTAKSAIENHFDTNFELEWQLEQKGKLEILDAVRSVCPSGMRISSVRQSRGLGLGHAILCAREMVNSDDIAILLPDVLINNKLSNHATDNLAAMIQRFNIDKAGQVMVEAVSEKDVVKYGVADIEGDITPGTSRPVRGFVEKPAIDKAPSNLAVVGRYVLPKEIWPYLEQAKPGAGGEIQLTDAIDSLVKDGVVEAYYMTGKSHDCGYIQGYVETFIEYANNS